MSKTIYSDYTDINGTNYETVGENIRDGHKSLRFDDINVSLTENTEMLGKNIGISANNLRTFIIRLLTTAPNTSSIQAPFCGTSVKALTTSELNAIKKALGITTA